MKKIMTVATKVNNKANAMVLGVKNALKNRKGEGYVDSAIKIIIAVVLGGLLLAGLYALFNTVVIPNMTSKVSGMFNYSGTN